MSALEDARVAYEAARAESVQAAQGLRDAQRRVYEAEDAERNAKLAFDRAEAAADSHLLDPGTRVHHARWADITGTVVESDGSGICILQDGSTEPTRGFRAGEWVVMS